MALNLSLSAADLAEQNRMNEAEQMRGDVTELSQGPERDNKPIELAMSRVGDPIAIFKMLNDADPIIGKNVSDPSFRKTNKVPTPQEQGIVTTPDKFSYRETQKNKRKNYFRQKASSVLKSKVFKLTQLIQTKSCY